MAQLCCPEMFFSRWGGSAIGRAFVQRNKKLLQPKKMTAQAT